MATKWENGRYLKLMNIVNYEKPLQTWVDYTKELTLPELEQAVIDNHLTVYQALNLAYLLGKKQEK